MSTVYIKFDSREVEAEGVEQLAQHTRVSGFLGGVYSVRRDDLKWLEAAELLYRFATEEEVEAARGSVRHTAATLL